MSFLKDILFFLSIIIIILGHAVQHVGSLFPNWGLNPYPLHLEHRVSTTGQPGKYLKAIFKDQSFRKSSVCFNVREWPF